MSVICEQPLGHDALETVFDSNASKGHNLFEKFDEVKETLRKRKENPKYQKYGSQIEEVRKQVEASQDKVMANVLDQEGRSVGVQLQRLEDDVKSARVLEETVAAVRNCFLRIPLPGTGFFYAIETPKEFTYHLLILILIFWVFKLLLSF